MITPIKAVKRTPTLTAIKGLGYIRDSYENQRGGHVYWFKAGKNAADFTTVIKHFSTIDHGTKVSTTDPVIYGTGYYISQYANGTGLVIRFHKCKEDREGIDVGNLGY